METEPSLQLLTGELLKGRNANTKDEARVDIKNALGSRMHIRCVLMGCKGVQPSGVVQPEQTTEDCLSTA